MVPWASESVSGNWLALRGPRRSGLYHEAAPCNSKLLLRLGSKTPTDFPSLVLAILMGSWRSQGDAQDGGERSWLVDAPRHGFDGRIDAQDFALVASEDALGVSGVPRQPPWVGARFGKERENLPLQADYLIIRQCASVCDAPAILMIALHDSLEWPVDSDRVDRQRLMIQSIMKSNRRGSSRASLAGSLYINSGPIEMISVASSYSVPMYAHSAASRAVPPLLSQPIQSR